jgi:hypothetical protein
MRIKPRADEKPATGFSWADYEDVRVEEGGGVENDADGEDDGWGVVQSRGRTSTKSLHYKHLSLSLTSFG